MSYSIGDKVKAAGFTRVLCEDGKPVGNHGAAKVLGVNKRRIIEWGREEEKLKGKMNAKPQGIECQDASRWRCTFNRRC